MKKLKFEIVKKIPNAICRNSDKQRGPYTCLKKSRRVGTEKQEKKQRSQMSEAVLLVRQKMHVQNKNSKREHSNLKLFFSNQD